MIDPERSRRGRSNRRRGNDWERRLAADLAGRRVGQYGEAADVLTPLFAIQAKVGGAFSERHWRWLMAIPRVGGRIPVLIVGDAPDPGCRRRAVAIVELGDWRDLHGEVPGASGPAPSGGVAPQENAPRIDATASGTAPLGRPVAPTGDDEP